jgi:hypothetical protein
VALVHIPMTMDHKTRRGLHPSCHRCTGPWGRAILAHNDVPEATDGDFSIHTTEEMNKYESLCHREFAHTRVYDVNMLERVGLDEELPSVL